jgi:hypothetical protein
MKALKEENQTQGLNTKQLARRTMPRPATVGAIENGRGNPIPRRDDQTGRSPMEWGRNPKALKEVRNESVSFLA